MTDSSIGRAAAGDIDRDCPCLTCGYNLRTCAVDAKCPECGTTVRATLRGYAGRLAGEDRRWLRRITNGAVWLALAMLFPWLVVVLPFPEKSYGPFLTADRLQLMIGITPAVFAAVGCWLLGSGLPDGGLGGRRDQLITRWGMRVAAVAWFVPLLMIAGAVDAWRPANFLRTEVYMRQDRYAALIAVLTWSGLIATPLVFRRLRHLSQRIPSRFLADQCFVIGSQVPLVMILLAFLAQRFSDRYNQAFGYAVDAPLPGAGLPWLLVLIAPDFRWIRWDNVSLDAGTILAVFVVLVFLGMLLVTVAFTAAMVRVRRADAKLPGYCRARMEALAATEPITGAP